MLVLSRKRNESVEIHGPDGRLLGTVQVADIRGDKVRLGFTFPKEIGVHRSEIADAIRRGNGHPKEVDAE
jgi:carbon storage regulator CsrA